MNTFDEHLAEMMEDSEFAQEYEALQLERELMMAACSNYVRLGCADWQQYLFESMDAEKL